MGVFDGINAKTKKEIVAIWAKMNAKDRDYFIDQVALALSVWGSDDNGRGLIVGVLERMVRDGSGNLSDFGLYVEEYAHAEGGRNKKSVMRAGKIIDDYRLRNALSSVPHKEWL